MTRPDTALGRALAGKGILQRNVDLQIALAKYQNDGGEYGVALAMLNAAYGKGSEGRVVVASNGRALTADASPTNDGEAGREIAADKAPPVVPASPSTEPGRGVGLTSAADKAIECAPSAASCPGHAKRGVIAIGAVQGAVAKSLFDETVLPDGRKLRDVRWAECPTLAKKYRRLSRILMAVHNAAIPPDPNASLDTVVSEADLKSIITSVEKFNEIR